MVIKIKPILILFILFLLFYTRFINLSWGLPYSMHPDERNMAIALMQLKLNNGLDPGFMAYGQFPLYLGYVLLKIYYLIISLKKQIDYYDATIILRFISAISSVLNVFVLFQIIKTIIRNTKERLTFKLFIPISLILIFVPYAIQFSHFGTTESLLMLFYSLIIYSSIQRMQNNILSSLWCGLAIATKISSVLFIFVPLFGLFMTIKKENFIDKLVYVFQYFIRFISLTLIFSIIFSPYNYISFEKFVGTLLYESSVASGKIPVFYTKQFEQTIPVLFQTIKVFPYALGIPLFVISIGGFLFLSWKDKTINLLRFAFLIYFVPNAFLYAKWTRFMSPIFPIMMIFALMFLWKISNINNFLFRVICYMLYIICLIPGLSYLSIYQASDVRFQASDWIYKNIPNNSYILSETANVIDIPVPQWNNYQIISFNFYDLENNPILQNDLQEHIRKADYIFIPSRRIFKNYPSLYNYYKDLFSGGLGFEKTAEFTSYPKISLFGKTILEFPDEDAEETWTVFDHPVIRIYKRIPGIQNQTL